MTQPPAKRRCIMEAPTGGNDGICTICCCPLNAVDADGEGGEFERGTTLYLECGHGFHGHRCMPLHVKSKCDEVLERTRNVVIQSFQELNLEEAEHVRLLGSRREFAALQSDGYMRQCPSCRYGPVLNMNCGDMQAHDLSRGRGSGRTTNECPHCGFFSARWEDWDRWSLDELRVAVRCPVCRGPCELRQDSIQAAQDLQLEMEQELQRIIVRYARSCFLKVEFYALLQLVLAEGHHTDLDADSLDDNALFESVQDLTWEAFEDRMPRLLTHCLSQYASSNAGEDPAEVPISPVAPIAAVQEVRNLSALVRKSEERWSARDYQLTMTIAEHVKSEMENILKPLVRQRTYSQRLLAALRPLGWGEQGFQRLPDLEHVASALQSILPSQYMPSMVANGQIHDVVVGHPGASLAQILRMAFSRCPSSSRENPQGHSSGIVNRLVEIVDRLRGLSLLLDRSYRNPVRDPPAPEAQFDGARLGDAVRWYAGLRQQPAGGGESEGREGSSPDRGAQRLGDRSVAVSQWSMLFALYEQPQDTLCSLGMSLNMSRQVDDATRELYREAVQDAKDSGFAFFPAREMVILSRFSVPAPLLPDFMRTLLRSGSNNALWGVCQQGQGPAAAAAAAAALAAAAAAASSQDVAALPEQESPAEGTPQEAPTHKHELMVFLLRRALRNLTELRS